MNDYAKRFDLCLQELNKIKIGYYKESGKVFELIILDNEKRTFEHTGFCSERDMLLMGTFILGTVYDYLKNKDITIEKFAEDIKDALIKFCMDEINEEEHK